MRYVVHRGECHAESAFVVVELPFECVDPLLPKHAIFHLCDIRVVVNVLNLGILVPSLESSARVLKSLFYIIDLVVSQNKGILYPPLENLRHC